MPQPLHLALRWQSVSDIDESAVAAHVITRARGKLRDGTWTLGGECRTKGEIDELIDELIRDCEIARKEGHARFDRK